jgi:hypothetical protein
VGITSATGQQRDAQSFLSHCSSVAK